MADTINIAKLKTDAFDAIDTLFSENDGDTSFEEQTLEETEPSSDEFAMLDEYTLALDWEYSDNELDRLSLHLDTIIVKHPDKHNQTLVKTIKIIIHYLKKAKEKAYPQTLTVMADSITTLKDINTKDFDEVEIKHKVNSTYNQLVSLKQKIAEYNKKFKKHTQTRGIDADILTRLDQLEEKLSYLEKQNIVLKQLMSDQYQGVADTVISDVNSELEEDTKVQFGVDSFSTQEPVIVDVDDILIEPSPLPATHKGEIE